MVNSIKFIVVELILLIFFQKKRNIFKSAWTILFNSNNLYNCIEKDIKFNLNPFLWIVFFSERAVQKSEQNYIFPIFLFIDEFKNYLIRETFSIRICRLMQSTAQIYSYRVIYLWKSTHWTLQRTAYGTYRS